jgi:S1-C subfamily serine protease
MRQLNALISAGALTALLVASAPPAATAQVVVPPPAGDPTPLVDRVPVVDPVPPADRIPPVDRPNQIAVQDLALRLGMDLRATADGRVVVAAVHPDSQAAALGIQKGDVLTSIERQPITAETTVVNIIAADNPEKKISLVFLRDGQSVPLTTAFPDRVKRVAPPPRGEAPAAGVSLFGLTAGLDARGRVMVVEVVPDSAAALAGAMAGDILVQVDGVGITSLPQFAATAATLVRAKAPGDKLTIDAIRKGSDEAYVLILREHDFQAAALPPPEVAAAPEIVAAAVAQPAPAEAPPAAGEAAPASPRAFPPSPPDAREALAPRAAPAAADNDPQRRVIFCMAIHRLASGSLVVTDVKEGSPADVAGIRAGDALVSVAGEKIDSLDEFADLIGRQREGDTVQFGVVREDKLGMLQVKMLPCEYTSEEKIEPVAAGGLEAEVRALRERVAELEDVIENLSAAVEELQRP